MKVLLCNNESEIRSGYLNYIKKVDKEKIIDKYADVIITDFVTLPELDYGEADEIVVPSLIEQIPNPELFSYLKKWIEYLSINGIISIGGTELLELATKFVYGSLNEIDMNINLYPKFGCYSTNQIVGELKELGLEIETTVISNINYLVKAKRVK